MALRYLSGGESHGPALTAIVEGMPAGIPLTCAMINSDLVRRQRGAGSGGRMLIERDQVELLSGVLEGLTTGAPITIQVVNLDHVNWKGREVEAYTTPRPGHGDLAASVKYGYDDLRLSLERGSARETTMRVAVGAVCRQLLHHLGITVDGYVTAIGGIEANLADMPYAQRIAVAREAATQCPDQKAALAMEQVIAQAESSGNTLGGIIEIVAQGVPPGIGSHVCWERRLDARLAYAVMGVNAMKGVEIGDAFENSGVEGTRAHDAILLQGDKIIRPSNRCGGIEGGISNGEPIWLRTAMKPIATTRQGQPSVDLATGQACDHVYERSDICPVPRAVVVVESVVAIVLATGLLEKTGGDSLSEIKPRFEKLRQASLTDLKMPGKNRIFWT